MIEPAPTSRIDPALARGILTETVLSTATRPSFLKLTFPDTNYELHLRPDGPVKTPVGKRIIGTINAQARRVDAVKTGGRYIEPVYGHPRRVQGSVIATDDAAGTITVDAGVPIVVKLTDQRQKPVQFPTGTFVSFDVLDGATFTPAG